MSRWLGNAVRQYLEPSVDMGYTCDMNDAENKTIHCHKRIARKRLAGEKYHESPKECFTEKADEKGYCRGAEYGQSCSNNGDADCDVDLYCSERKVCEHAKLEGENCHPDWKCASYLMCTYEDGVIMKCRPYGTYSDGTTTGPGDEDDVCHSRYINNDYKCEKGPALTHPNLRDTPGEKCIYTHGDNDVAKCFYHNEGKAICRRGAADIRSDWDTVFTLPSSIGCKLFKKKTKVPCFTPCFSMRYGFGSHG